MEKLSKEAEQILTERFGKDTLISLATAEDNIPYVRTVNGFYENGVFYIITYKLSNKMRHIEKNPVIAISGEWFTAHGMAVDLGYFGDSGNAEIAKKLRTAFREWIDNGHNDFGDINTRILCVRLTDGVLFSHGTRFDIDFSK